MGDSAVPSFPERISKIAADGGDRVDIALDVVRGSELEFFILVHPAKCAPVPGAVAGQPQQQGKAAAFTGGAVNADFEIVFLC